jgi:hypothetical protein
MSQTIQQQVFALEQKRSLLNAQVMEESDAENRNRLESELRAVEVCLARKISRESSRIMLHQLSTSGGWSTTRLKSVISAMS